MNQQVIEGSAESKESLNSKAKLYTLESDPKNLLDISALMIHRLNAGYKLDSLKHNAQLAGRFMHYQSQYSSKNLKTKLMQGTKIFWQWLDRVNQPTEEDYGQPSSFKVPNTAFKDGIFNMLFPLAQQNGALEA